MQIVKIQTNIRSVDIPDSFEQDVAYNLSTIMDIQPDNFLIIIEPATRLKIGNGSRESPFAFVNLTTTRPSSQLENDNYAKNLTNLFKTTLKLDSNRVLITFDYKDAKNIATQGKTLFSLYS